MTKQAITTTLYQTDCYGTGGGKSAPPENAVEFIQWLSVLIHSVPEQYRAAVQIEFDDDGEYDRPMPQLTVYWSRLETDDEERGREAEEKAGARRRIEEELAQLERRRIYLESNRVKD